MAAANGSWHGTKSGHFVFARPGESKQKAANRYGREGRLR